ncbi:MAG: beta-ketoacyl-[acyl-carrier-protein] synthase family protein [Bacteroidales bacterium]|jgi:3-oxoacyl-[acyl-carrier-protein] synthase-1|nr:beta-ketoacyl-[acyl-carrier-protein] synthase family protein [Bacteroidales bacterium]
MGQRIVVSGIGIVSALGLGKESTFRALCEGKSGISSIQYLQTEHAHFPVGEVKLSNAEMMDMLGIKSDTPHTRTSLMGMIAAQEALEDAHISQNERIALANGITVGGMDKTEQYYLDFLSNHSCDEYIAIHDCGACSEMIADHFGELFNQLQTISTACSSAANAIMAGAMLIKNGRADMVLAGGTECITKFHLNGFNTLMILDNEPCKPFDANRHGINLGEGAAYVVLETKEHFLTRNAELILAGSQQKLKPLAVLSGYANTCDAFHQTASSPDGEGAYRAMKQALETAHLQPSDIDYINAHGTGTNNNDNSESAAISRVFGDKIPAVSSTKGFTGHATSAAGGLETVISILALQHNFMPPNLNFSTKPDDLPFTPLTAGRQASPPLQHVLSNSFGFGGNNTSLLFSKYGDDE